MPPDLPLAASSAIFETAFTKAPMGVAVIGLDGTFLRVNPALCEMLGRSAEEIVGSKSGPFTHPDDLEVTAAAYRHLNAEDSALAVEKRYVRPNGEIVWAATQGNSVLGEDGEPAFIVAHFKDITAARVADRQRAEAQARFEAAFDDAPIGMALVSPDGRFFMVNRALCELTGYPAERLVELTFQEITHPDDLDGDLQHLEQLLAGEIDRYRLEKRYIRATGEEIWVNLSVSLLRGPDGRPMHLVAQIEDISDRKRLEASLQELADHDSLTKLWNRRRFEEELDRQVGRCRRYGEQAALLMIDLDGFKPVNDKCGHKVGDELLIAVAAAMRSRVRVSDSIARLGGDEFAVLLPGVTAAGAGPVAAALRRAVAACRLDVGEREVGVTASIGIALLDRSTADADGATLEADAAMYAVKIAGHALT
jgi:diguanylate cyclase (GGDEF)-like protein/PAS domain S-box-containing protein